MQLDVHPLLRRPTGTVHTYDIDEPSLRVDDTLLSDVSGAAELIRTNRGLLVRVLMAGRTHERCSRCLVDAVCPIAVDFQEEYVPVVDADTGARVRIEGEGDLFRIGPDFVLDLREALRQYTLMAGPAKPLCKTDCAGLCANCGADLNAGPCECNPLLDERWQALAGLKTGDEEGTK